MICLIIIIKEEINFPGHEDNFLLENVYEENIYRRLKGKLEEKIPTSTPITKTRRIMSTREIRNSQIRKLMGTVSVFCRVNNTTRSNNPSPEYSFIFSFIGILILFKV